MASQRDLAGFAEDARKHFAHLSVSAGERLFSPRSLDHPPAVQFLGSPTRASVPDVASGVAVGSFGESLSPPFSEGGVLGSFSLFLMKPEFHSSLCLGSVAKGLKYCTLRCGTCSYTAHSKKVKVVLE